jgi:hypothetical protein
LLQVVVIDPSRSRGSDSVVELGKEEACLLSGPTVSYSGATDIYYMINTRHMDYLGLVMVVPPTLLYIIQIFLD